MIDRTTHGPFRLADPDELRSAIEELGFVC